MEFLLQLMDIFLHLDRYLGDIIKQYGVLTYLILFIVIFCETGLVVTPFLPGDSLLFACGALAATTGSLNVYYVFILLTIAAIIGDTVNYWIGHFIGPKVFHEQPSRFFKKEYLLRTQEFYEKHGGKTIVIARFVPIIRTFAPFVAGIGKMNYSHFIAYNVGGGILWTFLLIFGGYCFGAHPFVQKNFSAVILAIIVISILPGVIEFIRQRNLTKAKAEPPKGM